MHQRTALLLGCLGLAACAGPTGFDYRGVTASAPLSDSFRSWRPDGPRHALSRMPAGVMLASAECVPFARAVSGVDIVGDAWTWWEQAQGRYRRGRAPEVGAVMVFRATDEMPLGHVAVVTAVLGPRAVLVSHRNWAGGLEKGRIDLDRPVQDTSARNDWSAVRVWHEATRQLGPGAHPLAGFVHPPSQQLTPHRFTQGKGMPGHHGGFEVADAR